MGYKIKETGEVLERLAKGQEIKTYFEVEVGGQVERFSTSKEAVRAWSGHELPLSAIRKRMYLVESVEEMFISLKITSTREREVVPWFPTRKLRGRIWGYSKSLRDAKQEGVLCAFATVVGEEAEVQREVFKEVKKAGRETRWVSEGMRASWEITDQHCEAVAYLEKLREVVPKADIEAASARLGPAVDVEIIPLREPQAKLMKIHSPKLLEEYREHYLGVFRRVWGKPTARAA